MTEDRFSRSRRNKKRSKRVARHVIKNTHKVEQQKNSLDMRDIFPPEKKHDARLKVRGTLISKKFELSQNEKLKAVLGIGQTNQEMTDFWALRNVNFEVYDGEAIGVVGLNGSGKSTLLNMIDSSLSITAGELEINGDVSRIAIGAGLKADLTGRDNIRLKCTMMGMSKKEIANKMDEIVKFSELGPFIDRQVKDYSSGMRSKLAFSIAINQDPDILIIDEALSVGDSTFSAKSAKKMFEFREKGKTIFVVSHNTGQIRKWTDKVIWLHYGEVKEYGATKDVLPKYQAFIEWFNGLSREQQEQYKLDRRKEQQDYSVAALKQEVLDNSSESDSQTSIALIDETIAKSKKRSKLTFTSKCLMLFCIILMFFTGVVSAKGNRLGILKKIAVSKEAAPVKPSKVPKKSSHKSSTPSSESKVLDDTFDYIVQEGEFISGIAAVYGLSSDEIIKLNPSLNPSMITPGMVIKLPKSVEDKLNSADMIPDTNVIDTTTDTSDTTDTTDSLSDSTTTPESE
ncbi:Teichoic acids export ATP-binding protein TagH [Lactococcus piscium]|nr:Teichoic acids export ATP-binding protein TagH [Lactococcus piscium]